ncbi:biotin transporter BioY [Dermatophilus congolensis]|uniref:biotin transporter BioY n=1 Tax=Dermatophilus congolensis TaxID=1863 RepID=UPI001AB05C3D|nr:biotin transporter BioY [Dermatophilus congolensis]MBO3170228.1 biotin transporter BioY [Dermatophilus congolensis]
MPGSSESVQKFTKVEGRSRGFSARDLSLVASFAALIWVLGVPGAIDPVGSGVPITLQTLGVMLAGAVLGARRGAAASLVVIALCAIGLPVLAGGRGGLGVFVSRGPRSLVWQLVGCLVGGVGVIHAVGVPVMAWRAHLSVGQALLADAVFVPGDVVKVVVAVGVAVAVHRAVPELLSVGGGK